MWCVCVCVCVCVLRSKGRSTEGQIASSDLHSFRLTKKEHRLLFYYVLDSISMPRCLSSTQSGTVNERGGLGPCPSADGRRSGAGG
uniref:Putative secreted protein n=1 Tax=Anopheles darlingi TaxID=43151 RepID=A0A2M4D292_ANODA